MLFNLFGGKDINKGLEAYKAEDNAVLLDVRTRRNTVSSILRAV